MMIRDPDDADARIAAIVSPPAACPGCVAEAGQVLPAGVTSRHCPYHLAQVASSALPRGGAPCQSGAHRWLCGQHSGWIVCANCGLPSVCKTCMIQAGRDVAGLPEHYCLRHASPFRPTLPTFRDLAARCIRLAGTVPASAWQRDPDPAVRWESVLVQRPTFRLLLAHSTCDNCWRVQVFTDGEAPVFLADGPFPYCTVRCFQPGSWYPFLLATETLRDGAFL